ncbi:NAD(P)-dependent dehydrogenase (short-subunit alcohol dehydrogenase family) [Pseudonocardia eucalypti]|uniref:SDR family NAD(P)-dependent oxidoreductase n=1 Tax=Pseudonocardia eucalypti TaxID=648755 RepID=UPI0017AB664B|nr:NAD(P)-dependent dehydrogenase (short-subunit alcohol dehydrogenase family) [Pseudonocardia eucalypti]
MENRVALVTGGSRGIGRAIALRLAADGAAVAVNYRRDADAAEDVVSRIKAKGGTAKAFAASVDDPEQDRAMVDAVLAEFGKVDILVHSAGIASRGLPVTRTDPGEPLKVMATHAFGAHHLCRLLIPQMREQPRGDVVFISSVAGINPMQNGAPYSMAKAALESLAVTLGKEELRNGIRVNVVAPGLVETDMGDRLARALSDAPDAAGLDHLAPFGRVCQPEDVADTVAFVVGTRYVNLQRIGVDGGGSPTAALR